VEKHLGLSFGGTFQVNRLCIGTCTSFAKVFVGFYFGEGIEILNPFLPQKARLLPINITTTKKKVGNLTSG
jgi:hypothetical protein